MIPGLTAGTFAAMTDKGDVVTPAWLYGVFALAGDPEGGWLVSHAGTGILIPQSGIETLEEAIAVADVLADAFDWTRIRRAEPYGSVSGGPTKVQLEAARQALTELGIGETTRPDRLTAKYRPAN